MTQKQLSKILMGLSKQCEWGSITGIAQIKDGKITKLQFNYTISRRYKTGTTVVFRSNGV